jgi:hypothetical protein
MSDVIDWSKAPEGYPIWVENMMAFGERGGWHKELSDRFIDADGKYWPIEAVSRGTCKVHRQPHPAPWSGEGLPPVGAALEVLHETYGWIGAKVVGQDGSATIVRTNDGYAGVHPHELRPIRTAEQIAADEREASIREMTAKYSDSVEMLAGWAAYVYDTLGYRKQ